MKNNTDRTHSGIILFWFITICHYIFGATGLVCTLLMATAKTKESQQILGLLSVIFIIAFALTQFNSKCRRLDTGWDFLDRKINFLKRSQSHK
jgi:DMSO/TMAO reductase YedYZ heme-binding membrane subunit